MMTARKSPSRQSFPFRAVALLSAVATMAAMAAAPPRQQHPPTPPDDAAHPLLVWDVAPGARDGLPRSFRTTGDTVKTNAGQALNTTGLAELHASGSSAFTEANFKSMLARLPGAVTVFDLRQEDHIYVNGEPVSWYASNNWANAGRTHDAIVASEAARVAALKPGDKIDLADAAVAKGGAAATPQSVVVARAATERDVVIAAGAGYERLTISDHTRPTDSEVDRFIVAVRALPPGQWVHFHCRAGKGRTTTVLALYDMLRNAGHVSLEDIVNRQSLLIGDYNLLQLEEQSGWKAPLAADRAAFVRGFYDYAHANPNGRPQLWTEWLKAQTTANANASSNN
jgi:protein-tyrosine phosphatase